MAAVCERCCPCFFEKHDDAPKSDVSLAPVPAAKPKAKAKPKREDVIAHGIDPEADPKTDAEIAPKAVDLFPGMCVEVWRTSGEWSLARVRSIGPHSVEFLMDDGCCKSIPLDLLRSYVRGQAPKKAAASHAPTKAMAIGSRVKLMITGDDATVVEIQNTLGELIVHRDGAPCNTDTRVKFDEVTLLDTAHVEKVTDAKTLHDLQGLLTNTHKTKHNWTRDRGCSIHGRNGDGCDLGCAFRNRNPVPKGFRLVAAERNHNEALFHAYDTARATIRNTRRDQVDVLKPESSRYSLSGTLDLDDTINEWRLVHGTNSRACKEICRSNFDLAKAGSGATWKGEGPLYGKGVYFSERSTKADEYAAEYRTEKVGQSRHAMLVCRVLGGRYRKVDIDDFNRDELIRTIDAGEYDSVYGAREERRHTYNEVIVYKKEQIYPEFIVYYERIW